ncbi:MAG: hypothetical protein MJ188_03785 [Treponema sp.]|nr:hypothetical protein [Treponema sp.]
MKKLLSVVTLLFVLGTAKVFSLGIGAQGGFPLGGALTVKVDEFPCVFAVDAQIGATTGFGLTADWWLANPTLSGSLGYFYGVGAGGDIYLGNDWATLGIGPRAFVGLNLFLLDGFFELYLQGAYQPSFNIALFGDEAKGGFDWLGGGLSLGFRFWF